MNIKPSILYREGLRKIMKKMIKKIKKLFRTYTMVPLRQIFPPKIPYAMITGSKGKTTTTRMLAHILSQAGHKVGFCTTDGIVIDGKQISQKDSTGYSSAHKVLTNPSITAGVLETARGDLINKGLYIKRSNVAALLNVGNEQIGMDGINSLEEMALHKKQVIDTAEDAVILNADDSNCISFIDQYPSHILILFSMKTDNELVQKHLQKGGRAYIMNDVKMQIERVDKTSRKTLIPIADLPSSGNGIFPQNIANAMAAAALAEGMNITMDTVRSALHTFNNSLEQSLGRLNLLEGYTQTVLLDKAVHIPSAAALVEGLKAMNVPGQRVCMYETIGGRQDWHYAELGEIFGPHFDHFICYEGGYEMKGRTAEDHLSLLKDGLIHAGVSSKQIDTAHGFDEATKKLSKVVGEKDLVVVLTGRPRELLPIFRKNFSMYEIKTNN